MGHVIEPILKQLSATASETASFYVRHDDKPIALFRVEPSRAVRASVQIGQEYAIAQGASGKVLLAFSSPVAPEYQAIREQLWAVSYGEQDPETASAAAPVFGVTGELHGALAISGPRQRLAPPEAMHTACRQLLEAARDATVALGGVATHYSQSLERLTVEDFGIAKEATVS